MTVGAKQMAGPGQGPLRTREGMNQGTTTQSDRRPGVGQVLEHCGEGYRYAPGHTLLTRNKNEVRR